MSERTEKNQPIENKATTDAAKEKRAYVRTSFINEFRDNSIVIKTSLTPLARRYYRNYFDGYSRSVALMRYYARISRISNIEDKLSEQLGDAIEHANSELDQKIDIADGLIGDRGIRVRKPELQEYEVTIIDPLANRYLQLIEKSQMVEQKLTALWLACLLSDTQRRQAMNELEKIVKGIQQSSRKISMGLRDRVRGAESDSTGATVTLDNAEAITKLAITTKDSLETIEEDTVAAAA
ncbi:MAG: hypothetical protein EPN89_07075 [Methylovulum sp.]|nr:MAG: hypothetical protein EPN89_07075 [Methylovulum sp.]